jgi:gamma-butyrobetaine dioxygenase
VVCGLTIVEGVAAEPGAGLALARKIGFLRKTNFGESFEVISKPDPNNLAYTSLALPLHTDLANQELPPGYQFLHCIANEAAGGGSVFADGVAMAEALRDHDDPAPSRCWRRAHSVPLPRRRLRHPRASSGDQPDPWRECTRSSGTPIWPVIFDMPAEVMEDYYRAYRAFMALTRDAAFHLTLKLRAGEMVVFDNRRVLHGRDAFDPSTGRRHLQGCYVDRGEMLSRLRVLSR